MSLTRTPPPPDISVVIPTRDREDRLRETLRATLAQRDAGGEPVRLEILVIDDGSSADLSPILEPFAADPHGRRVHLETQPAAGPAAARNRGVALARAERVLFLGDDTRPAAGAIEAHLEAARRRLEETGRECGVQGRIEWDPEREITELMRFLAPAGPQFYFRGLREDRPIPFTAVLGSNFSAPRAWLEAEPFDERFPHAAVEDTEMAWRWRRLGWESIFRGSALCFHHHLYDRLEPFLERQRRAGSSARYAVRRHPRLLWPLVLQPTLFGAVVKARAWAGRGRPHDRWDLACRRAFWRGFRGRPGASRPREPPP
ncbi:MAG: glycosyltransferase [Acidobacteriota bacterium]